MVQSEMLQEKKNVPCTCTYEDNEVLQAHSYLIMAYTYEDIVVHSTKDHFINCAVCACIIGQQKDFTESKCYSMVRNLVKIHTGEQ